MNLSRQNNFNLIRLIAALQVMLYHGLTYFEINTSWEETLKSTVYLLPGVPIFFTISGFLIYQSLERNNDNLKRYFKNRIFRIYPALWVCLAFTLILLAISKQLSPDLVKGLPFFEWLLAQITFFQFYKIPELAFWGTGHPNGSLWSISVEVQFYLFLPLLFLLFKGNKSLRFKNLTILVILLFSIAYNYIQSNYFDEGSNSVKLFGLFLPHYLYFFCTGILIHLNFKYLKKFLVGKAWLWIGLFFLFTFVFKNWLDIFENVYESSVLGILGVTILSIATISSAYSMPNLSSKLLKGNDMSYGIYIYHMPIINYFYHQQTAITWQKLVGIFIGIILLAFLSWHVIEKNALKFKTQIS